MPFRPAVIHRIDFFVCDERWSLTPARSRAWTDLDLWLIEKGRGTLRTPEGSHPLGAGTVLLMRGGEDYEVEMRPEAPFHHYYCHFAYVGYEGPLAFRRIPDLPPLHRSLPRWTFLGELLERAQRAHWKGPEGKAAADRWLSMALQEIASVDEENRRGRSTSGILVASLEAIAQDMARHPEKRHSIAELAEGLGVSRAHFGNVFRRTVGRSPQEHLQISRMNAACNHLRNGERSVREIAELTGFESPFFFSRQFRKRFGMPPTAFRKGGFPEDAGA